MFKMKNKVSLPQKDLIPKKENKRNKIIFLLVALIAINAFVFGTFYFSIYQNKQNNKTGLGLKKQLNTETTPPSIPFGEITIPYLRSRTYQSVLGKLNQATEASAYTGYLTSYNSDGLRVNGYLTIPKEDPSTSSGLRKPKNGWPAIVFVHGYIPPQNYRTLENYSEYVDYLAGKGFVVFKIDLRGNADSQGEPGGGYYSSDYIIDTLNARAALQKSDFINPKAVGLWGHSMAGNVVARALAAQPEIPAIVIWAGAVYTYSDFAEFGISDNSYNPPITQSPSRKKRNEMFAKYGQFNPNSSFWKLIPMTNYLSGIKGAIQLNHAVDDSVVDIRYSRNLNKILDVTKIIHELNEYPSGGHNISGESFNTAMQNTVEFFKKYLK